MAAVRGIGVAVITSVSGMRAAGGLVAQRGSLLDAEPMLFVDHDHAERREVDLVLDQRMCADGDVDRAVGDAGEHVLAVGRRDLVREQLDPQRPVAEQVVRDRAP